MLIRKQDSLKTSYFLSAVFHAACAYVCLWEGKPELPKDEFFTEVEFAGAAEMQKELDDYYENNKPVHEEKIEAVEPEEKPEVPDLTDLPEAETEEEVVDDKNFDAAYEQLKWEEQEAERLRAEEEARRIREEQLREQEERLRAEEERIREREEQLRAEEERLAEEARQAEEARKAEEEARKAEEERLRLEEEEKKRLEEEKKAKEEEKKKREAELKRKKELEAIKRIEKKKKEREQRRKKIAQQLKKDEEKKKAEAKKKKAQQAKKKEQDFENMLKKEKKSIAKARGSGVGQGNGLGSYGDGMGLTESDAAIISSQVVPHWIVPGGVKNAESLIIKIRIKLKDNGEVIPSSVQILDMDRYNSDFVFKSAADSAKRAILEASPFKIPSNKMHLFRDFDFSFNTDKALRGG